MQWTEYVPLISAFDVGTGWESPFNAGQIWSNPGNAVSDSLFATAAFSSSANTQSRGLAFTGFSNLLPLVGDKAARLHALQFQFQAQKIGTSQTMRFAQWSAFFGNILSGALWDGTGASPNTVLSTAWNTYTLGTGFTSDLAGFDGQALGYTGNAEYITVEKLDTNSACVVVRFTGSGTPGNDVQVRAAKVRAFFSSNTTLSML